MLIFRNESTNLDIVKMTDKEVAGFGMYELDLLRGRR